MHLENRLFDEKAERLMSQLKGIDLGSRTEALGGTWRNGILNLPLFGRPHHITGETIRDHEGNPPTPAVVVLLCRYLLTRPEKKPAVSPEWITLRDVKGADVSTSVFLGNTQKIIETAFTSHLRGLAYAAASLGGSIEAHPDYDLTIRFHALPRIPILLHFNDAEVGLPARCALLFHRSCQDYLDLESLSIAATYLAGNLTR